MSKVLNFPERKMSPDSFEIPKFKALLTQRFGSLKVNDHSFGAGEVIFRLRPDLFNSLFNEMFGPHTPFCLK